VGETIESDTIRRVALLELLTKKSKKTGHTGGGSSKVAGTLVIKSGSWLPLEKWALGLTGSRKEGRGAGDAEVAESGTGALNLVEDEEERWEWRWRERGELRAKDEGDGREGPGRGMEMGTSWGREKGTGRVGKEEGRGGVARECVVGGKARMDAIVRASIP
jgi:hypothetical protein